MGVEIPLETRFQAEEYYIIDGLTYEKVAEKTGVSVSQLQRWGSESGWAEKRREYRQANASARYNKVLLEKKLLAAAMDTMDPQMVYAAVRLGAQNIKTQAQNPDAVQDIDRPKLFLEDLEFIAGVLKEIDPEGLKAFARNFETIINRFKAEHAKTA